MKAAIRTPTLVSLASLGGGLGLLGLSGALHSPAGAMAGVVLAASSALLHVALSQGRAAAARPGPVADVRFDILSDLIPDALIVTDGDGVVLSLNTGAEQMFGPHAAGAQGAKLSALFAEECAAELDRRVAAAAGVEGFPTRLADFQALGEAGRSIPVELSLSGFEAAGGTRVLVLVHDASVRKRALARLNVAETVFESTAEGVMVTDRRGTMLWVNHAFCRISGYGRDEVIGKNAGMLKSGLQGPDFYADMWHTIRETGQWAGEIWNRRKDGQAYPEWLNIKAIADDTGEISRYVGVFSDISKHKQAEETIRTLTYYDPVTRLPNRHLFGDRLHQAMERAERNGHKVALVMIGLDRFRTVNETLGHQTGDQLLRMVAERLAGGLRGHDTVARLRGDTFCCLLTDLAQNHDIHLVLSRLMEAFAPSFEIDGAELFVTASVGVSLYPLDGTEPDELIQKADTAMNRAKECADNLIQFYTPEMHANSVARLRLETDLRKAVSRGEFLVHYQPKVCTLTGRLVGAEALVRWRHPELGMVSPADFIPMAEDTGLIVPVGAWVLDSVCAQQRAWLDAGLAPLQVAVNLSAVQFRQPDLVERVAEVLDRHGLEPSLLELELTESAVMRNAETAVSRLMELHQQGVRLAVDDFGTGYSSLSYLKRFPLDKLKIDRSFVQDVEINATSAEIVGAIIAMAHSLGLNVVAEGVETAEQLKVLRDLKCDEIQGFYFSKPVPAETLSEMMRADAPLG